MTDKAKALGQIRLGSTVRQIVSNPTMIVTDVIVDKDALLADPAHPKLVAVCEFEEPEQEEGMGPHRVTIALPFERLEHIAEAPPQVAEAGAANAPTPGKTPKAHQGKKEDPAASK